MNKPGEHYEDRVENLQLQPSNLVFIFNPAGQVLLYKKVTSKTDFNIALGKRNGLGGKMKEEEGDKTNEDSARRESIDEGKVEITKADLKKVGTIRFYFRTDKKHEQQCDVYFVTNYTGPYGESKEMKNPTRFDPRKLPEEEMRPSDKIWLPKMLNGEAVLAAVYHEDDGSLVGGPDVGFIPVTSFDQLDPEFFSKH